MLKARSGFLALAIGLLICLQSPALAIGFPTGSPETAETSAPAYLRALKRGCRGADVRALQEKLTQLGLYSSVCDGFFGRVTENAVKAFQRSRKLKADGIVGRATHGAIYAASSPGGETGGTVVPVYTLGKLDNQITLRKGSQGANVRDLQTVLTMKGFYKGAIDSRFQNSTKSAVQAFQRSVRLEADGLAGNYTLSALYTMIKPPDLNTITPWIQEISAGLALPVEKLTWSDASGRVFKRNTNAVVVDARTGYAFNVRRTGGTKHADVETLTPLDTATFYKCSGGFSWDRRPIWVIVNGHRLAASMNCMPHGYDSIPGNDFKGQFCIHFVGSRTHGTNHVDPDHQACIQEAYQLGLTVTALPTPEPTPTTEPTPTPTPTLEPTPTPETTITAEATPTDAVTEYAAAAEQVFIYWINQ